MPRTRLAKGKKQKKTRVSTHAIRATVKSIHHRPGLHALNGSQERLEIFRGRALHLKMYGHSFRQIGEMIAKEYELESVPPVATVFEWIEAEIKRCRKGKEAEADAYVALVHERTEAIIRNLIPLALDPFAVSRKKVIKGEEIEIIDEDMLKERIAAVAEIRKNHELMLRALGVYKAPAEVMGGTTEGTKTFIMNFVTQHIAGKGEKVIGDRAATVLELIAGDDKIDSM
jgi:hypothetical protein